MAEKIELRACPFCGSKDVMLRRVTDEYLPNHLAISCWNCNADGPLSKSGDEALKHWNQRASDLEER